MESRRRQRQSQWISSSSSSSRTSGGTRTPGTGRGDASESGYNSPAESKFSTQEENWGALSNLRVESDQKPHYYGHHHQHHQHHQQQQQQQQQDEDKRGEEEEHGDEETKASDLDSNAFQDRVSKSSLSFILDDYNESSAASSVMSGTKKKRILEYSHGRSFVTIHPVHPAMNPLLKP